MQDPDMPGIRYHTVIFVETNCDESGFVHHVTGDLVVGMTYEIKRRHKPEDSETPIFSKEPMGTVSESQYPGAFDKVCAAQPEPPPQKAFNPPKNEDGAIQGARSLLCSWRATLAIDQVYGMDRASNASRDSSGGIDPLLKG